MFTGRVGRIVGLFIVTSEDSRRFLPSPPRHRWHRCRSGRPKPKINLKKALNGQRRLGLVPVLVNPSPLIGYLVPRKSNRAPILVSSFPIESSCPPILVNSSPKKSSSRKDRQFIPSQQGMSGRQRYDVATSYGCWADVGLLFLC